MKRLAVVALTLAILACAPPAREAVSGFGELAADETVVVGRVELHPPLAKGEQHIGGNVIGGDRLRNKVMLIIDEKPRRLTDDPGLSDYHGRIEAAIGETFFVRSSARPFYILTGQIFLAFGGHGADKAYVPAGLKVNLRPGDKAVYIGTLRYTRDEYFEITKSEIVDDYNRANAEFQKRFGTRHTLRKALAQPMKRTTAGGG